jgi:hypothetical protein
VEAPMVVGRCDGTFAAKAMGVMNPSDEEMAMLVATLVAKRTTNQLNIRLRSDIKPL